MSQEQKLEANTGNSEQVGNIASEFNVAGSTKIEDEVNFEDPKTLKQKIKALEQEIRDMEEARQQMASAKVYSVSPEDIADQHIVELANQSKEEKLDLIKEYKDKLKKSSKGTKGKLFSFLGWLP